MRINALKRLKNKLSLIIKKIIYPIIKYSFYKKNILFRGVPPNDYFFLAYCFANHYGINSLIPEKFNNYLEKIIFQKRRSKGPLVSIIIPVFNVEEKICRVIESIFIQNWSNIEVIVVDDRSTDKTGKLLEEFSLRERRLKVLRNYKKLGFSASKKIGLNYSLGEYIIFSDIDLWMHPQRINSQIKYLLENPNIKAVGCKIISLEELENNGFLNFGLNLKKGSVIFNSFVFQKNFLVENIGILDFVRSVQDVGIAEKIYDFLFAVSEEINIIGGIYFNDEWLSINENYEENNNGIIAYESRLKIYFDSLIKNKVISNNESYNSIPLFYEESLIFTNVIYVDVIIITDLRFPGGNASTTLDEYNTLVKKGLRVKIVHCPSDRSIGKKISNRFDIVKDDLILDFYGLGEIQSNLSIIRNPNVIASKRILEIKDKVKSINYFFIVNNSKWYADLSPAYDFSLMKKNFQLIESKNKYLFAISESIKNELESDVDYPFIKVESLIWNPLFSINDYYLDFVNGRFLKDKIYIGRHSRDHRDKWPDEMEDLFSVYPECNDFIGVKILGGIESISNKIGRKPKGWIVYNFGEKNVKEFLSEIDFFVYFPSEGLHEAFGRIIIEAIYAGLPCILPQRFKENFGELAYYCDESEVIGLINNLLKDKDLLEGNVKKNREIAIDMFESNVIFKRFESYKVLLDV